MPFWQTDRVEEYQPRQRNEHSNLLVSYVNFVRNSTRFHKKKESFLFRKEEEVIAEGRVNLIFPLQKNWFGCLAFGSLDQD